MAEFPALPLWTDAYLADTMHLTCMESGAYLHLLIAAWRSPGCNLPDDDKLLPRFAKCTPAQWRKVKDVVSQFWAIENDFWTQKRLSKERNYVNSKRNQQSLAGKASALKRQQTTPTDVDLPLQRTANEQGNGTATPIPTPIPTPTPLSVLDTLFDQLWSLYPKRSGANPKAKAKRAVGARLRDKATEFELIEFIIKSMWWIDDVCDGRNKFYKYLGE